MAAVVVVFSGIAAFASSPIGNRGHSPPVEQTVLVCTVAAVLIVRSLQVRIVVSPQGIRIHNFLRNHTYSWEETVGFEPPAGWSWRTQIVLADRSTRTVDALCPPLLGFMTDAVEREIDRIERARPPDE
jgi:hypothetical protein